MFWFKPKFKKCTNCKTVWPNRDKFLQDKNISLIGYQVNFAEPENGLFLFDHCCKTTLAIYVKHFMDLYTGPLFTERKTGGPECPGYCLYKSEMRACPSQCECASIRNVIEIINKWKKI